MLGALLWGIGASMALAEENEKAKDKPKQDEWHLLKDGYPEVDKLVRVRTFSGMEHICEVTWYYPDEDEIGYGSAIISFYELNGEWIDDNDIKSWCELQPVPKEFE